jgi:cytoskeletal protein CcmA (bactofilin family)
MAVASIIGQNTTIRGNLRGTGSLDVRGRVEGDIEVDGDVALGEDSTVSGNISGAQISVAGSVLGDLRGTEAVLLERGARVVGDLVAPRIGIAEGALVRGGIRTEGETSAQPRRAAVVPARRTPEFRPRALPTPAAAPAPAAAPPAAPRAVEKSAPNAAASAQPEKAVAAGNSAAAPKSDGGKGPPAPVVPSLGKGARGKKKSKRA